MSFIYNFADTWNASGTTFAGILLNVSNGASGNPVAAAASQILNLQTNGTQNVGVRMPHYASGTDATPFLNLVDIWNTSGNVTGIFYNTTNTASGATSKVIDLQVGSTTVFNITKGGALTLNANAIQTAPAAATLQLGAADAAAPVAQVLQVQNVVTGTSNTAGTNLTINGSIGTGTGAGGSIIFQTAAAGGSGSTQNTLAAALTITSAAAIQVASAGQLGFSTDLILTRKGAAVLQLGAADAASPVAQTVGVQNVVAGNANTAAANFTIRGGLSNGSGGGDLILQTTLASAGSGTQNTAATALTLKGGTQIVNVATQMGVGTAGAATTSINVAAGTTAIAPITLNSGTNLTTAAAGAVEFDGTAFYATAAASARQVAVCEQFTRLVADYTLTDSNAAQKVFNATTNGTITLAASTTYFVQGQYMLTNTGTTSHTWAILFAGGASITALGTALVVSAYTATSNALTASNTIYITGSNISSATVVTAASTSSTENVVISFQGFININGAGTLIPQIKASAQPNGTEKILAGSYISLQPVGTNTISNVGNWS